MQFLEDLKDEIIILNLHVARDSALTNTFFGKVTGRVRVIESQFGDKPTTWVGDFAFAHGTKVGYDETKDEYDLRVAVAETEEVC